MEVLLVLLVLLLAVLAILAFVEVQRLTKRVNSMAANLKQLRLQLELLNRAQDARAPTSTPPQSPTVTPVSDTLSPVPTEADAQLASTPTTPVSVNHHSAAWSANPTAVSATKVTDHRKLDTEFPEWQRKLVAHFKDNWLVWCGGLALVFGMGYLVQFISTHVHTTPTTRIVVALLISVATVAFGEWLHRRFRAGAALSGLLGADYIPAAIVAAGTTGIYAAYVFAVVSYHLLSPMLAMLLMALTSIGSMLASLRYGSLMAVLGLIGGYIAPLWLSSTSPNYYLLAGYISAISAVGLYVIRRRQLAWLLWGIIVGQLLWMVLINLDMPEPLWWMALFYPLTAYLLITVPERGWRLWFALRSSGLRTERIACRGYHSLYPALILSLMLLLTSELRFYLYSMEHRTVLLAIMACLLWQPLLNAVRTARHIPLLSTVLSVTFVLTQYQLTLDNSSGFQWLVVLAAVWWMALSAQGYLAYRQRAEQVNRYWFIVGPQVFIASLMLYSDADWPSLFWLSSLLSIAVAAVLAWLAYKLADMRLALVGAVHGLVWLNLVLWFDGPLLSGLLAVQVLIVVVQMVKQWPALTDIVAKVLVSIVILRLSVLPFMSSWYNTDLPDWSLTLLHFMPVLLLLYLAYRLATAAKLAFVDWLEGGLIHLVALFCFVESHYLVTGSYALFEQLDLISCSFWLMEALVLCAVYGIRQQRCQHQWLQRFYRYYRYALLLVVALVTLLINLQFMPLWDDTVSGELTPLFNPLALGWLLPALLLFGISYVDGLPELPTISATRVKHSGYAIAGALLSVWWLLSLRQFWQPGSMALFVGTTMAEWLSYSVTFIVAGCGFIFAGVRKQLPVLQKLGLVILGCAALKVFLSDIGHLDGVWRVVSFLGLGGALIGIGRLFQLLKRQQLTMQNGDAIDDTK
ncbi:DUF2339 domain-containing protein [Shewanella avicenniae]|uniref:DUF2339 domain-containing protein n=1 Tax=Shewanella avicenniae TaxID=2814294 RepID=A0ABX7QMG4_9GAMM|nr:DUF2339 domain-containing protein [Shewanella avicenniae]QSX32212.1 DUF2339 domain-containing protein [Shewanella avicenniae]